MSHLSDIPPFSPATLVINLNNLRHNLDYFKGMLSPHTRIMAMVKANAYGCGAVKVSEVLLENGVEDLGVAYTKEGVVLRKRGIGCAIMVMNPSPQDFPRLVRYNLEPEIAGSFLLKEWMKFIRENKLKDYPVHIEVDTGMKRLGFSLNESDEVIDALKSHPGIHINSVFTHLASSQNSEDDAFTKHQFDLFNNWYGKINAVTVHSPLRHILNSAGICRFPEYQHEMVRLGIGLYGVGLELLPAHKALRPVQSLYAAVTQVREVNSGDTIGYGRNGSLKSEGRIAVINLGYADGIPRLAGEGRFSILIRGQLCPVVGTVCMDMTMVDVSALSDIRPGEIVEVYGINHPVLNLADAAQTIPYEVLTANHRRVQTIFRNE